jgi:Zn-dependent protease
VLAVFNLTPLPPLDGGRILVGILPIDLARKVASLEKYGLLILFGLLYLGIPNKTIEPAINYATSLADKAILANANKHLKELREEEKLKPEENK